MSREHSSVAIDYMVERSLGLLLGDLRAWKRKVASVGFSVSSERSESALGGAFLPDLVLAFNLWKAGRKLTEGILLHSSLPRQWATTVEVRREPGGGGQVDWARTFERWAGGKSGFVTQSRRREMAQREAAFVAKILAEFVTHCEVVGQRMVDLPEGESPSYLLEVVSDLESFRAEVSSYAREVYGGLGIGSIEKEVRGAWEAIFSATPEAREAEFLMYGNRVRIAPPRGAILHNIVRRLQIWRERFLSCRVGLRRGESLRLDRGGSPEELYEMWSFYEMCAATRREGLADVTQHYFIRRRDRRPKFRVGTFYVYYDFRLGDVRETAVGEVLRPELIDGKGMPGVFVEWFIRHERDFARSVCIDAKYGEWESREVLKVLGYMRNFGVLNGAIVSRVSAPERSVGGEELVRGLRRVELPGEDGAVLWLLRLVPEREEEESNSVVARAFARRMFGK